MFSGERSHASGVHRDGVFGGGELADAEIAGVVGGGGRYGIGAGVLCGDLRVGNGGSGRIDYRAPDGAGRRGLGASLSAKTQYSGDAETERRETSQQTTRFHSIPPRMTTQLPNATVAARLLPGCVGGYRS